MRGALLLVALVAITSQALGQQPLMQGAFQLSPGNDTAAIPLPVGLFQGFRVVTFLAAQAGTNPLVTSAAVSNDEVEMFYSSDISDDAVISGAEPGSSCEGQPSCDVTFQLTDQSSPLSYVWTVRSLPAASSTSNVTYQVFASPPAGGEATATMSVLQMDNGTRELTTTGTLGGQTTTNVLLLEPSEDWTTTGGADAPAPGVDSTVPLLPTTSEDVSASSAAAPSPAAAAATPGLAPATASMLQPPAVAPTTQPLPPAAAPAAQTIPQPPTVAPALQPLSPAIAPAAQPSPQLPIVALADQPSPQPPTVAPAAQPIPQPLTVGPAAQPIPQPLIVAPAAQLSPQPPTVAPATQPIPQAPTMAPAAQPIPQPPTAAPAAQPILQPPTVAPAMQLSPEFTLLPPAMAPAVQPLPPTEAPDALQPTDNGEAAPAPAPEEEEDDDEEPPADPPAAPVAPPVPSPEPTVAFTEVVPGCAVNLCFALDMGTQVEGQPKQGLAAEWSDQQELFRNIVKAYGTDSWFSAVAYNEAAYAVAYASPSKYSTIRMVNAAIPTPGGSNYASPLLLCAQNVLAVGDNSLPMVVVLLSDSDPNAPDSAPGPDVSAFATATALKETYGIKVITAAYSQANVSLLQVVASASEANGLPLTFETSTSGALAGLTQSIARAACGATSQGGGPYQGQVPTVVKPQGGGNDEGDEQNLSNISTTIINTSNVTNITNIVNTISTVINYYNTSIVNTNITSIPANFISDVAQAPEGAPPPPLPSPVITASPEALRPSPAVDLPPSPAVALPPSPAVALPPSPAVALAPSPAVLAPAPAPFVGPLVVQPSPVPTASPTPGPQCETEPMCRLYLEDMVCCEDSGIVGNKTWAQAWVVCTEKVWVPPQCLTVTGPGNATSVSVFQGPSFEGGDQAQQAREYEYAFEYRVSWSESDPEYQGPVTLELQGAAAQDPECRIPLERPCYIGTTQVAGVAAVDPITFHAVTSPEYKHFSWIPPSDNRTMALLDSFVWADLDEPEFCQMQGLGDLPDEFFAEGWATYNDGFSLICNNETRPTAPAPAPMLPTTATVPAAAPAPSFSRR